MHLRHLELHGYKSFANKTEFVFNGGITAIVGPNGSGKSNIADAIRWVLGEKRQSSLRARRTEDLIFAGTDRRGQVGMAQVSMTLDNGDRWLPTDFTEVTITRRAYRSSENEYLLNGTKVRLQDIVHLLGQGGLSSGTYTVIGQGMIDAALSLQPEQRRPLFEDAAGLSVFQAKRAQAMRKLAQTEENLQRARDIMQEIAPRLERLKRQAARAEEHATLDKHLRERLRLYYGYRWHEANAAISAAEEALREARARESEARIAVVDAEKRLAELRKKQEHLRNTLESDREAQTRERETLETRNRELSVMQERHRLAGQRQEELAAEIAVLEKDREAQRARVAELEAELAALTERMEVEETALAEREAQFIEAEKRAENLQESLANLRRERARLSARLTEADRDLAQSLRRRKEVSQELAHHQEAIRRREEQAAAIEQQMVEVRGKAAELAQQMSALSTKQAEKEAALRAARRKKQNLEQVANEIKSELRALRARYDLLDRLRKEGAGLDSGVKAVVRAAESDGLKGVIGPVARLFRVPEELQLAIQAALDTRAQAVILDTWENAATALAWVRRTEAGRVELLIADRLNPPRRAGRPRGAGVLGIAAEMVECHPDLAPIVRSLLGSVVVVENWDAAQRAGTNGFAAVTLSGERITPQGLLLAGSGQAAAGELLAVEREYYPLGGQIAEREEQARQVQKRIEEASRWENRLASETENLASQLAALEGEWESHRQTLANAERERERAVHEIEWRKELVEKAEREIEKLSRRQQSASQVQSRLRSEQEALQQRVAILEGHLSRAPIEDARQELAQARTAVAILAEQIQTHRALLREHRQSLERLCAQLTSRREKLSRLQNETVELEQAIEESARQVEQFRVRLEESVARVRPALSELNSLAEEQLALEEKVAAARERHRICQESTHQAELGHVQSKDALDHLVKQMTHDLGFVEPEEVPEGEPRQTHLPFESLVTTLPTVTTLPKGLEQDVQRLRRQLGRMGAINPDAPQEYAELRERYDFLETQSDDLQKAAQDLRRVTAELDEVMRDRFRTTFEAIAEAFSRYFTRLFGGGEAQLVLTDSDDLMSSGIEIVARVPGKRRQPISLLSGGERALTAASLIFALVEVSKTPFCLLDEVDAMLDESNVGKFRDALLDLSKSTQFIVITHNRGTIEAAETIYGISLADSGVSRVISLKLDQAVRVAKS